MLPMYIKHQQGNQNTTTFYYFNSEFQKEPYKLKRNLLNNTKQPRKKLGVNKANHTCADTRKLVWKRGKIYPPFI